MEKHIPLDQFQEALTTVGKYTIEMSNANDTTHKAVNEPIAKSI